MGAPATDAPFRCVPREEPDLEAYRLTRDNAAQVARWCGGRVEEQATTDGDPFVHFDHGDEPRIATPGDVIVRGCTGRYFAVPTWLFDRDYREAR